MTIRWETLQVDGKAMRVYLSTPDRKGPLPGVLVAQHAGGVDEQIQDVVHRLHREGYVAAAPELFHRLGPDADPKQRTGMLIDTEIMADLKATVQHLKTLKVQVSPLGIIGFCMGGRVVYLAATAMSELKAAVMFYGGNTMKALGPGPSPFEQSSKINCPLLGFFGVEDANPSQEDMKKIDAELTRLNKTHEFHSYLNTGHAFQNFLDPRYRERASRSSWAGALAFFTEHLKRGSAN